MVLATDSGPPGPFQGYFEHKEMAMMQEARMAPDEVLFSATGGAAACMGLEGVGTLEPNPSGAIRATRTLDGVWVGGARVG